MGAVIMLSGGNNGSGSIESRVTVEAYRQVFLPQILSTYLDRGYAVLELPQTEAVRSLVNGGVRQWLQTRREVAGSDLETIMRTHPQAAVLKPCTEYIALPKDFGSANGNSMVVNYRGIEFSAHNFVIGGERIFVAKALTGAPVEITLFEYLTAVGKLPLAKAIAATSFQTKIF